MPRRVAKETVLNGVTGWLIPQNTGHDGNTSFARTTWGCRRAVKTRGLMCGIAGAYSLNGELPPQVVAGVSRMRTALHHRGPDASGMWTSPDGRTTLVATRLAIGDLSSAADQPFTSDRRATVYNGVLYDWTAVTLERGRARTSGDTEARLTGLATCR